MAPKRHPEILMAQTFCDQQNSILEVDLEMASRLNLIDILAINETEVGYYVSVTFVKSREAIQQLQNMALRSSSVLIQQLLEEQGKLWFLTTRRERNRPRLHKHLGRLNDFLRQKYPTKTVLLIRDQPWPGRTPGKPRGVRPSGQKNTPA